MVLLLGHMERRLVMGINRLLTNVCCFMLRISHRVLALDCTTARKYRNVAQPLKKIGMGAAAALASYVAPRV